MSVGAHIIWSILMMVSFDWIGSSEMSTSKITESKYQGRGDCSQRFTSFAMASPFSLLIIASLHSLRFTFFSTLASHVLVISSSESSTSRLKQVGA